MKIFWLIIYLIVCSYAACAKAANKYPQANFWLPVSYKHYQSLLMKAADAAFAEQDCHRLVDGSLLESRSTPDLPYFIFHCRTQEGILFTIEVNGDTLALKNIYAERLAQRKLKEKQQEEERLAIERARKLKEAERYWSICEKTFKKKTRLFDGLTVLTALPPKPSIKDKTYIYRVNFDAVNMQLKALSYRATCTISNLEDHRLSIKPRRKKAL